LISYGSYGGYIYFSKSPDRPFVVANANANAIAIVIAIAIAITITIAITIAIAIAVAIAIASHVTPVHYTLLLLDSLTTVEISGSI